MAGKTRVPRKDSVYDQYIRNTTIVLETGVPTGIERLNLTAAQGATWIGSRDQWIDIYPKFTNLATRTTAIKNTKNSIKKDFILFAETPLKVIEVSVNLTDNDRLTFNLPKPDRTITLKGAITDVPFAKLKGTGGGILEVRVRREHDATRSSMHLLADAVEFRYMIVEGSPETPDSASAPAGALPGTLPFPEKLPFSNISKAAFWRMNLGAQAQGKRIFGFVRWINLSNPANNSGWSDILSTIIS